MAKQLILTRGLPASGKSTFAKMWVAQNPTERTRVCRDDLRQLLYAQDAPLPRELEEGVTTAERATVRALLKSGRSVVVDAMHLRRSYITEWERLAAELGADFSVQEFIDVEVEELLRRDAWREGLGERYVGDHFILETAQRYAKIEPWESSGITSPETYTYEPNKKLHGAWMVDIDGTLALMNGKRGPFDWHRVGDDDLHEPVAQLVSGLDEDGWVIILMSGRDEVCRSETEAWLTENEVEYDHLFMRSEGDMRKDSIVKLELFREHVAPKFWVQGVLDDRASVVRMWRDIGLFCTQVADGNF